MDEVLLGRGRIAEHQTGFTEMLMGTGLPVGPAPPEISGWAWALSAVTASAAASADVMRSIRVSLLLRVP